MITLFVLLCIILGMIIGYRRSLILQSLHTISMIGALTIAAICYRPLAGQLHLLLPYPSATTEGTNPLFENINNEDAFYNIMAILLLFLVSKVIIQIICTVFDFYHRMEFGGKYANIYGIVLGFIEAYIMVVILLSAIAVIPLPQFIDALDGSSIAKLMLTKTPFLSDLLVQWLSN